MAEFLSGLKTQVMAMLPQLIETAEPQMESKLREVLRSIKTTKPAEAGLFLSNWKKLDKAVQEELSDLPTVSAGRRKKTRKVKKRTYSRKH